MFSYLGCLTVSRTVLIKWAFILQLLEDCVKNVSFCFLYPSFSFYTTTAIFNICLFFVLSGDGKCVICDSYVRPCTLVRICDECNYGSYQGRCVICGGPGVSDAYYCKECTMQEKDVSLSIFWMLIETSLIDLKLCQWWFFCIVWSY